MHDYFGPLNLILLAVPGIALRVAVRVVYGPRTTAQAEPFRIGLLLAGPLLIVAGGAGALVAVSGPGVVPLGIIAIIAALMISDRLRRAEHRALLWSLAVAAERGIPLSEAARAYADENLGDRGARAIRLA